MEGASRFAFGGTYCGKRSSSAVGSKTVGLLCGPPAPSLHPPKNGIQSCQEGSPCSAGRARQLPARRGPSFVTPWSDKGTSLPGRCPVAGRTRNCFDRFRTGVLSLACAQAAATRASHPLAGQCASRVSSARRVPRSQVPASYRTAVNGSLPFALPRRAHTFMSTRAH